MQGTCPPDAKLWPIGRATLPLRRRIKCCHSGYELGKINAEEVVKEQGIPRGGSRVMRASILPCGARRPIPRDKNPPEGHRRAHATNRKRLPILGVKDIDAAEKKVRKTRPFNQWKVS